MSKKNETNGNATRKVAIEVSAAEYDMLSRCAKALNEVAWTGGDNTVASVVEAFCLCVDDKAVFENIVYGINTKCRIGSMKDADRRIEVQDALADALAEA